LGGKAFYNIYRLDQGKGASLSADNLKKRGAVVKGDQNPLKKLIAALARSSQEKKAEAPGKKKKRGNHYPFRDGKKRNGEGSIIMSGSTTIGGKTGPGGGPQSEWTGKKPEKNRGHKNEERSVKKTATLSRNHAPSKQEEVRKVTSSGGRPKTECGRGSPFWGVLIRLGTEEAAGGGLKVTRKGAEGCNSRKNKVGTKKREKFQEVRLKNGEVDCSPKGITQPRKRRELGGGRDNGSEGTVGLINPQKHW